MPAAPCGADRALPSLPGFVAPWETPIFNFAGAQNVAASDPATSALRFLLDVAARWPHPIFTHTSVSGMSATSDPGPIARRCMPLRSPWHGRPGVNTRAESHGPIQGPTCASRHKKAHWHRWCDQSHSQMGIAGPVCPCETPNNKWVGPLFRRSVGVAVMPQTAAPFDLRRQESVCCLSGGLIFRRSMSRA
jgi:hypothetical protein